MSHGTERKLRIPALGWFLGIVFVVGAWFQGETEQIEQLRDLGYIEAPPAGAPTMVTRPVGIRYMTSPFLKQVQVDSSFKSYLGVAPFDSSSFIPSPGGRG